MMRTLRIGSGAGYSGDRIEPALAIMEHGDWLPAQTLSAKTRRAASMICSRLSSVIFGVRAMSSLCPFPFVL